MTHSHDDFFVKKVEEYGGRSPVVTFVPEPEAEPLFCPIISVDDHALEPPDLFEQRLSKKFRDAAPRIVRVEDGSPWWLVDGVKVPILLSNGGSGRLMSEWSFVAADYDEMRRGVWDSRARLADMDLTGVWASLCFSSIVWGFAGKRFSAMGDRELGLACLRAYNEWMLDEWCAADRNRYIPCQLPWLADPGQAAHEIYANAERGFTSVSFSENPQGLGYPDVYSDYWTPFLRACEETQTVVNLHVGSSGTTRRPSASSGDAVSTALFPLSGIETLIDWIYAGIPVTYPGLKIALSEAGLSWVPMAIERLQRAHRQSDVVGKSWPGGDLTPIEIIQNSFFFTSIEDPSGFQQIDQIGVGNVMVETDYPHFDSTWPDSQGMLRSELRHLDVATIEKVCFKNAATLYRHPEPPAQWLSVADYRQGVSA